jgi:hypothetical protein
LDNESGLIVEKRIGYPPDWEAEYRAKGLVAAWVQEYPELFRVCREALGSRADIRVYRLVPEQ